MKEKMFLSLLGMIFLLGIVSSASVGINELSGNPQIISCVQDKTINSGDTYSASISVKNNGSQDGSFYGQIISNGETKGISEQYVQAGTIVNMSVQLSGINTNSEIQLNSYTIKIIDRKSQNYDTCTFVLGVEYQGNIVCSPNAVTCLDANNLKKCNDKGNFFTTEKCDFGCTTLDTGVGQCRTENNNNNTNYVLWSIIFILVLALVFVIIKKRK